MTVKKILFTASFVLMSLVFKADDHIKKDDIEEVKKISGIISIL